MGKIGILLMGMITETVKWLKMKSKGNVKVCNWKKTKTEKCGMKTKFVQAKTTIKPSWHKGYALSRVVISR